MALAPQQDPLQDSEYAVIEDFLRNGAKTYSTEEYEDGLLFYLGLLCRNCARSAQIVSGVFPLIRDHLRDMEQSLLDRGGLRRVGDEWALMVGALVQALAVEPDDGAAADLAEWLGAHYGWGLRWCQPAFVLPRRQTAVDSLRRRARLRS